jgi:DNA-binding LacI/PurR family transcriptional regulator
MINKEALSIKDIARTANVSHSTVSRALRNSPLVNRETGERILRIATESNFRVSAVGRSLATGRTHSIGVVVTSMADPFVGEVVNGIEKPPTPADIRSFWRLRNRTRTVRLRSYIV